MSEDDPRLGLLKKQTAEVKEIAQENVRKVVNRGDDLDDLQHRAEHLRLSAHEFDTSATRLRRKMCWQSIWLWIFLLFILLIILVTLIDNKREASSHLLSMIPSVSIAVAVGKKK